MSKSAYNYTVYVTPKQIELLINSVPISRVQFVSIEDIDVFIGICHILGNKGFQPSDSGMVRRETGCNFDWESISKYKTVVDFQLDWPYA